MIREARLVLELVDLRHHGAVFGGDPLVAVGALPNQRVVVDATALARPSAPASARH